VPHRKAFLTDGLLATLGVAMSGLMPMVDMVFQFLGHATTLLNFALVAVPVWTAIKRYRKILRDNREAQILKILSDEQRQKKDREELKKLIKEIYEEKQIGPEAKPEKIEDVTV
jgi:large-conductance mechanosensitive channel